MSLHRTPSTPLAFAGILLALTGIAIGSGALYTIDETLAAGPLLRPTPDDMPATRPHGAPMHTPAPAPEEHNLLLDEQALTNARNALEVFPGLEGHALTVFHRVHFYDDGRINIDLVDPLRPTYVDTYRYEKGVWRKAEPVNTQTFAHAINMERNSAPLERIDFLSVPRVARALQEQQNALLQNPGEVGSVYLIIRKGGELSWRPDRVTGDRETVDLEFDEAGALLRTVPKQ